MGVYRGDRAKFFSDVQVEGQEATIQVAGRKIPFRYKGKKIPGKVVIASGLREVVKSPVLEIFNPQLNKAVRKLT